MLSETFVSTAMNALKVPTDRILLQEIVLL